MKVLYTTKGSATGGREGQAGSEDGRLSVKLSTPKELGGGGGDGTNPEQLFAAGYSACFLGALTPETRVTATIGIGPRDDGKAFGVVAALSVSAPGVDKAVLEQLVQAAHAVCPYSNATRGNLDVRLSVE